MTSQNQFYISWVSVSEITATKNLNTNISWITQAMFWWTARDLGTYTTTWIKTAVGTDKITWVMIILDTDTPNVTPIFANITLQHWLRFLVNQADAHNSFLLLLHHDNWRERITRRGNIINPIDLHERRFTKLIIISSIFSRGRLDWVLFTILSGFVEPQRENHVWIVGVVMNSVEWYLLVPVIYYYKLCVL